MTTFEPEVAARVESVLHAGEMYMAFPRGRHHAFRSEPAQVTVCVPVYNAARSLERCLRSVLTQSGGDFQVLVVDNGSSDSTFADACRFAADCPNLIVYRNPVNVGRVPNWNRCLELASGGFVKFMMANDYLQPDCLRRLSGALVRYPSAVLACAGLHLHQPDGSAARSPVLPMSMVLPSETAVEVGLTQFNPTAGPTVQMLRRAAVEAHGLRLDAGLQWAADYDFALRLLQHGDLAYVHEAGAVSDLTVQRFNTRSGPVEKFREDAAVVLKCFRESGALAAGRHLEGVVTRLRNDYQQYRGQTTLPEHQAQLEQVLVSALQEFQSQVSSHFLMAA